MVTGPAPTPVAVVVVAVFVTFVCTGSADGAVLFAEAPAAESTSGTGSVPPPLIWAVAALTAVLGFCAAASGVMDLVDQAFRRGTSTPWAARRSLAAPAPPTSSAALVTRILATHRIFALLR